ncbi:MAG: ribosome biogenesis/translation initiation ATPase RLI, partial [Promethearchaeota archaeon]
MRIAVLDKDRCKPKKCAHECYKFCPGVRAKRETITFPEGKKQPPVIAENLCSGSGICVKKCPFHAIKIVNLPEQLDKDVIHRFGKNEFTLFRMPVVREKTVTGLVGANGIGKSTAIKILCGEIHLNLGKYTNQPSWETIIEHFRGSELQGHFEKLSKDELRAVHKPQYVDRIPKVVKSSVKELFDKVDEAGRQDYIKDQLDLATVWNRKVPHLSGGELQKVAVGVALVRDAEIYFFDEPSSYLDVYERLRIGRVIRQLSEEGKTVLVVEHDLALLDYLSDYTCIFYGDAGAYGIVSHPHGVREGINIFLDGYLPDDNMRFRET